MDIFQVQVILLLMLTLDVSSSNAPGEFAVCCL